MAPRVFNKTLALVMAWLRWLGVQLDLYRDDILSMGNSALEVAQSVSKTVQVMAQAGFILNLKKSDLTPTKDLVYIGANSGQIWAGSSSQREGQTHS